MKSDMFYLFQQVSTAATVLVLFGRARVGLCFDVAPVTRRRMVPLPYQSKLVINLQTEEQQSFESLLTMEQFKHDHLSSQHIGKSLDHSPALVLNADYSPLSHHPLSLWSWQDSLRAVFNGKAVVVNEYTNLLVRSVSCEFALPSVIALKQYQKVPDNRVPAMSRRNVYIRDSFRCQYCNEVHTVDHLSLDHVVPRSKGGLLTWTNTVTACLDCNYKKGSTPVDELPRIGMKLRSLPRAPTYHELQFKAKQFKKTQLHPHWMDFL